MMTKRVLDNIEPKKVLAHFEDISKIPRNSGNEKGISDYILAWALEKGLDAVQDQALNLIIKKPASKGYEAAGPVLLQAHMDMVCEKNQDSSHDFTKDPILLKLDGDLVSSATGTTLGADDGIGVAYCMAILEDETLRHPPLEVLLTTEEESTFKGAESVSAAQFAAKRMINLDHAVEDHVLAGSCGGQGVTVELPLSYVEEAPEEEMLLFALNISGLPGGHSGEDIGRGYGNAIALLIRALDRCKKAAKVQLTDLFGGTSRLAIPREAYARVLVPKAEEKPFLRIVEEQEQTFIQEYWAVAPDLRLCATSVKDGKVSPLTDESFSKLIRLLYLFPNGVMQMNGTMPGVVESSINLGIVRLEGAKLVVTAEMRSAYLSTCDSIMDKIFALCAVCGAESKTFCQYAPWPYNPNSPLREKAMAVYEKQFGRPLRPVVVHAGIECGSLLQNMPELDAISLGPDCWFFHSPLERMSVSSVNNTWQLLKELLAELKE